MPQTTIQPQFLADYPILAPAQKPGGVVISTTLWAHAVPNKPQWTGTQMHEPQVEEAPETPAEIAEEQATGRKGRRSRSTSE